MILEAYAVTIGPQPLVPAPVKRDWMSAFTDQHAYRCLPLSIGNAYGWQLLLPGEVTAHWNGGVGLSDLGVTCTQPHLAVSNFGQGVLTFNVGYIFRTPAGYHLLVTGPSNTFKDGAAPMTALVETDWLPYTFTFNYRFTRPGTVHWAMGEPYAQICVVAAGLQEQVQPIIRRLEDNPQLATEHEQWRSRRAALLARQAVNDPIAWREAWGKDYFLGRYADGRPTDADHTTKVRLRIPIDERRC